MKISKDEQNKKHSRLTNSIRSICFTLSLTLIIGICPVYANQTYIDVTVPDTLWSYIVNSDGSIDVSSADGAGISNSNNLSWYLGRLSQTIARIGNFTYQNGTYLATIYTYFSSALSDLRTYNQNTAASLSALLTLTGDQVNINWTDVSQFQGVSLTYGGAFVDRSSNYNNWNVSDLYWYFDNFNVAGQNFFRVQIPTRAAAQNNLNNYVDYIEIIGSNGQSVQADYTLEYDYMSNRLLIYFLNYIPFIQGYPFIVHIHYSNNISYFVNQDHKVSYLPYDTTDYIMKSNNLYLRELLKKDPNIEVNIDDSINSTNIELDVSIGINDFQEVNTISNKLRTWLSTGVGVSALIAALDQLDDSFFTLHNRSVIETINNQYTDFYD